MKPQHSEALHRLGLICYQQGAYERSVEYLKRAITESPADSGYQLNLANVFLASGRLSEAVQQYRAVVAQKPNYAKAHSNLGAALRGQGLLQEAVASYRRAIEHDSSSAEAHSNMANTLRDLGRLEEAITSYQQAIRIKPNYADAHNNMAHVLQMQGKLEDAISVYANFLKLRPDNFDVYSNMLMAMNYSESRSAAEVFEENKRYDQCVLASLPKQLTVLPARDRNPTRRLKVGYVSGDFRKHAVAYFIEPILVNHDKSQVEVFCYYNHTAHDEYTTRLATLADHWLDCKALNDAQLTNRIIADGIDILVDLSVHTAHNRLPVFARKPAPLQVTWLGYAGTTGLQAMDYRITDALMDPPGLTEQYHSEALLRLPSTGIVFSQAPDCPDVNELPALSTSEFIFASLNNLNKINQPVVNLWAQILTAVPHAKLMLANVTNSAVEQRLVSMFAQAKIPPERLILKPRLPILEYLALHHQIDLGLDPFPYNGGVTSAHSLWMGVPFIALAGERSISRFGVSLLSQIGLHDYIAATEKDYVRKAIELAQDTTALNNLRQSIRPKMKHAVMDGKAITGQLEAALREIWTKWCSRC